MLYEYNYFCHGECNAEIIIQSRPSLIQSIKECPYCGSANIERIWAPTASIVKCDGFFGKSTDQKNKI